MRDHRAEQTRQMQLIVSHRAKEDGEIFGLCRAQSLSLGRGGGGGRQNWERGGGWNGGGGGAIFNCAWD